MPRMTVQLNYLRDNLIAYEYIFTRFLATEYPLSEKFCQELKLIQGFLHLSKEQAVSVEIQVINKLRLQSLTPFNSDQDFNNQNQFDNRFSNSESLFLSLHNPKELYQENTIKFEDEYNSLEDLAFSDTTIIPKKSRRIKDLAITGLSLLLLISLIVVAVSRQWHLAQIDKRPSSPLTEDLQRERQLLPQEEVDIEKLAKQ